jgi:hypothetical protein
MSPSDPRIVMDDQLPGRALARVAGIGIAVILAGAAVSSAMVLVRPAAPATAGQAPSAIGMVEQTQIEVQDRGLAVARRERAALRTGGWVDADAGVMQVPIDQAVARTIAAYASHADGGAR